MSPPPRPRHLLLCFDAFGTLFTPKQPVHLQYASVARSLGLTGYSDAQLATSFRHAFAAEARLHPNYGKAAGLSPARWWTNIIARTFAPELVGAGVPRQVVEEDLAPRLLYRFATEEGYRIFEDVVGVLRGLPKGGDGEGRRVVVGLVTNSDDRTPEVLVSLGLRVGPVRFGREGGVEMGPEEVFDVDFSVMSYDVGFEKPDARIFGAAVDVLRSMSVSRGTDVEKDWDMVYVGDEYEKDVVGAVGAGWNAVLVDREGEAKGKTMEGLRWLDEAVPGTLEEAFTGTRAVGVRSMNELAKWLPKDDS